MDNTAQTVATCSHMQLEQYMPTVRRMAVAVQRGLGVTDDTVEVDDLVQFGWVGLLEASQRFDPARGTDFRWYAHRRIQGAIFDGLRKLARLPRRAHRLLRMAECQQGISGPSIDGLEAALVGGRLQAWGGFLLTHSPYPVQHDMPASPSPEELAHESRRFARVQARIDALPELEREIVRRHLFRGEPLSSIACELGISRTWAWRVLTRACQDVARSVAAEE